jgi:enamine deaminase RidA (YjgF/YER057c/UK114 family)
MIKNLIGEVVKTNSFIIAILAFLTLTTIQFGQTTKALQIQKEKFNINKTMEEEIGYTQSIKVGNTIYVSGSVGWGQADEALKLAYDRIEKALKHFNIGFENVVKENLYSTVLDSIINHRDVRKIYYKDDYPAATWVEVKRLYSPNLIVEVEVVAVLPENK